MQIFFHVLLHKKWCLKRRRGKKTVFIFPTRWQVFPHCGFRGFRHISEKAIGLQQYDEEAIHHCCLSKFFDDLAVSKAREWARKIVVILHHTKDIRKLSYEKEKARNSVQWYGIWPMGPKGIVLSLFYCIENEDLRKPENAKNVKPFDVANRQWLVQGKRQLNYFEQTSTDRKQIPSFFSKLFSIKRLLGAIFHPLISLWLEYIRLVWLRFDK